MNPNGTHDRELLEQIERLLEEGRVTASPLLDDLAQTVPQPRPDFQSVLEDQLLTRLQADKGVEDMTSLTTVSENPVRRLSTPLTLVAAMVAVILVGSILLAGGNKPSNPAFLVQAAATDTPASIPTVQASPTAIPFEGTLIHIVIALQNLPRGFQFPATLDELSSYVGYAEWPLDAVPFTALAEDGMGTSGMEKLLGKYLLTDLFREQPILSSYVTSDETLFPTYTNALLSAGVTTSWLPLDSVTSGKDDLQTRDIIDVYSLCTRVPDVMGIHNTVVSYKVDCTQPTRELIVSGAVVAGLDSNTAVLAINQLDAATKLVSYIGQDNQFEVVKTGVYPMPDLVPTPLPTSVFPAIIPSDRVAISLPISQINSVQYAITDGDHVDIIAGMMFYNNNLVIGMDSTLYNNNTGFQPITTPPTDGTPAPAQLVMQRIIEDALVVHIGDFPPIEVKITPPPADLSGDIITLAVTQQEAVVLQWVIEAKIPLTFVRVTPSETDLKPVVIARQFLPLGAKITTSDLAVVYWPAQSVPDGVFAAPSDLAGKYVHTPVEAWQPVTDDIAKDDAFWVGGITPYGTSGFDIARTAIVGSPADLRKGDAVDITFSFLQTNWPQMLFGSVPPINTTEPSDGYVVRKTVLKGIHVAQITDDAISVYWTLEDSAVYRWLVGVQLPFAVTMTRTNDPGVDLSVENLPDGKIAIWVPGGSGFDNPNNVIYPLTAKLLAHMTFINKWSDPGGTDQLETQPVTQIVAQEVEVTEGRASAAGDGTYDYRVVIPAENLESLRWFVNAGIPLNLAPQ